MVPLILGNPHTVREKDPNCIGTDPIDPEAEFWLVNHGPKLRALIVPLKQIEYWVYGDLIIVYPKPYSIYLRGTTTINSTP